ncbi:MAG: hypothetical protein QUV05_23490 [Phycisphaerae bacterium]|nr:hypothetical protein [Phycisphaerae bacterium]
MASQVKSGQWVNVKIVALPKSAAGRKTMIRLFEKDQQVKEERTRLSRSRKPSPHRRGGRQWWDRPPRLQVVSTEPGATYKVFGSVDVLRELESLKGCVEISPA